MRPGLRIIAPGLLATVQDLGRAGHQQFGIPVSGAFDWVSLRAANLIVGNSEDCAGLEIAFQGPTIEVDADGVRIAVVGAQTGVEIIGDRPLTVPPMQSLRLRRGERFRIGALKGSALAYLAVEGGLDVPVVLGSRSTYARGGFGGFAGRALRAGDMLPLTRPDAEARAERRLPTLDLAAPDRIRVLLGPQDDYFTERGRATLLRSAYTVLPASDRMGMRLDGPPLEHAKGSDIISDGIAPGAVQVPGNGLPIILLADRQTTGGYPKIATVISADLAGLGRLAPGSQVRFEAVDIEAAEAARRALEDRIAAIPGRLEDVRSATDIDLAALLSSNLVSGVVDAGHAG